MSSRCENQENADVSSNYETAGAAPPTLPSSTSKAASPKTPPPRRSARRRSVAPKLLEAAAANGSSIIVSKTKKSTRKMMSASKKEEQQNLPSDCSASAAAARKEQQSASETMVETSTTSSSQLHVSTEAAAPKEGEKPKEAVVPPSATRRSSRTRNQTSGTSDKKGATNPPPNSTRRKSSRKCGKEDAEAESKVVAVARSSSSKLKTNSATSQQQQPIDPDDDASALSASSSQASSARRNSCTANATTSFNKNATKTVPALSPLPEDAVKTVERIKATAQQLFEEDGETKVLDRPCVSARIFACYALQSCSDITIETIATDSNIANSNLKPIVPLLKALVHIESTSQGPPPLRSPPLKKRRVLFSAFDCSSTQPPVDRDLESAVHQQESIESMIEAKKVIDTVNPAASSAIQNFCTFLDRVSQDATLQQTIAAAVAPEFPPKRVASLAKIQRSDFNILHQRLSMLPSDAILSPLQRSQLMMSQPECEPISVEQCLADLLGQAIRFQLRMLLNAAPARLSTENEAYDQMAKVSYSKVSDVVNAYFVDDEGNKTPVGEGILSAPFSLALQELSAFFGIPKMLDSSNTPPELPAEFCASEPSQRKLSTRQTCYVPLSDDDVETILQDIEQATSFLATARAARFLSDLLAAPGVQTEIDRMGGWGEIETYASVLWNYDLFKWCPNDDHLLLLCNPAALHRRLPTYCDAMEALTEGCLASLEQLHSNLHLSTKSQNLLAKFPQIPHIAMSYAEGMERAEAFPIVETE